MTRWGDLRNEMRGAGIDEGTLDRLLRGRILPDDAPPGYSDVASILAAAASRPTLDELRLEAQHVVAARDAIARRTRRRRPGPLGLATGLMLIVALVVLPGLAMAHVLPGPAQHAVTTVLEKVGITIPQAVDRPTTPASPSGSDRSSDRDVSSPSSKTGHSMGVDESAPSTPVASGVTVPEDQQGQDDQQQNEQQGATDAGGSTDQSGQGGQQDTGGQGQDDQGQDGQVDQSGPQDQGNQQDQSQGEQPGQDDPQG